MSSFRTTLRTTLATLSLAGFVAFPSVSRAGQAQHYTLVELGTLGGTESFTGSVSDSKWIIGVGRLPGDRDSREFVYRGGKIVGITPLNSGAIRAGISTINNRGQIASGTMVGSQYFAATHDLKSNRTTILGSLGGTNFGFTGAALGINDSGQAVGYSYLPDGNRHAFLWTLGRLTDLGSLGGYSAATAINNAGSIVGSSSRQRFGVAEAFVIEAGIMTAIDPFGGGESYAEDINEHNQVVGDALTNDHTAFHGFLWQRGTSVDLGVLPDGRGSSSSAINNRGQVVGLSDVPIGVELITDPFTGEITRRIIYGWKAFLYERGQMIELNKLVQRPDWDLTWATDINDGGDIVGYGVTAGRYRAFLLTPKAHRR